MTLHTIHGASDPVGGLDEVVRPLLNRGALGERAVVAADEAHVGELEPAAGVEVPGGHTSVSKMSFTFTGGVEARSEASSARLLIPTQRTAL